MMQTAPAARSIRSQDVATLAFDVIAVLVFATIGRRSHEHGLTVLGILATATPFAIGTVVGWTIARIRGVSSRSLTAGLVTALCTVIIGMVIRVATGAGTAVSFIIVATCVLTAFLVGWRLVAGRLRRSRISTH